MTTTPISTTWYGILVGLLAATMVSADDRPAGEVSPTIQAAKDHLSRFRVTDANGVLVERVSDSPHLTFGDPTRGNESGTLWIWNRTGRPVAMMELYRPTGTDQPWIHAVTLSSPQRIIMTSPADTVWKPARAQFSPQALPGAGDVGAAAAIRLRQMKELSRRFTAHEFWDPNNSRFELRLLVQPVHRYQDSAAKVIDGTVFVLAHGTNPEALLVLEAKAEDPQPVWTYALLRLGSAEMHGECDGREVWMVPRTPGVVGLPEEPYWIFVIPTTLEKSSPRANPS